MKNIKKEYDIIVVGGGPAGATAGRLLSNFGHSVLIIDKYNFPREKLCGGLTTDKTVRLLQRIFDVSESSLKSNGIINYTSHNYEFKYKHRHLFYNKTEMIFHFVDRTVYDDFLLKKAGEAGAHVIQGDKVIECDIDKREIKTVSGGVFKAGYIIAADGVNSFFRKMFPLSIYNSRRFNRNMGMAFEIFVERDELRQGVIDEDMDGPVIFLAVLDFGFTWIFPRQNRYAIGIGGLHKKSRQGMLNVFREYLEEIGIDHTRHKIEGAGIPLGGYITQPVYKNIILTGDAGGYVDPILGEGIFFAQRTAELASHAIHMNITEGRPVDKVYKRLLWKYVLPEFFNARVARFMGFYFSEMLRHIPFKGLMFLMGGFLNDYLHGMRTNRMFFKRRIHEKVTLNWMSKLLTRP